MKPLSLAVLGLAAALAAPATIAFGQAATETPATTETPAAETPAATEMPAEPMAISDPQEFADMAASSNMFEIQSSELALEMSQNADVQAFAEQMVTDHTAAGEEMMAAAETDGITPASAMNEQHQAQYDELAAADEASFDQAYIDAQVMAHDEAIALFEGFSTEGEEGALRDFATQTLPTLQEHREHLNEMGAM